MNQRITERLRFEQDRTVTVLSGNVELGQGLNDALTLICSEELALEPHRIRVHYGDTEATPNDGVTAGSRSMERAGAAIRDAASAVRSEFIRRAAARLEVPENHLEAHGGAVRARADGATQGLPAGAPAVAAGVDYWALLDPDELGGGRADPSRAAAAAKPPAAGDRDHSSHATFTSTRRPVGSGRREPSWRRVDRVVRAADNFVHDLPLPGMVYGRVLRPPGYGQRLDALAADAARAMHGVLAVVVDGSFVAVAAEREEQAVAARDVLAASARWQRQACSDLPADGRRALRAAPAETMPILHRGGVHDAAAAATASATYSRPFLMHAALGPSAAAARLEPGGDLTIWSHAQGPFELRGALAEALQRAPESIRVIHVDGAGCYGHNGADDVALDAALLALAVPKRPVLVAWSREDENRWEPFGTAMAVTCGADLDANGTVRHWRHDVRSHAHGTRPHATPGHSTLLAAWHRAVPLTPPPPRNGPGLTAGPQRNAEPLYDFAGLAITTEFVAEAPLRVSALRSLGAFTNVFAIESFMDELAARCATDPLAYRLRHLRDARARQVLTAAVHAAPALPAPAPQAADSPATAPAAIAPAACAAAAPCVAGGELIGRGIAVARYKNLQACVAVVCDVAVDPGSGRIRLLHAAIAADAGRIIDRDGLANQLEGGFLQAASWTLKEEVRWDRDAIRSTGWDSYPVLRFSEVPPVTVRLIDRPDQPSVGAGEASQGPTPAAIANAVYAAAGIRLRHTPFTPARVLAALAEAVR